MNFRQLFSDELTRETAATRRLLERVPQDKLDWRPHGKSATLGGLAGHVALIPRGLTMVLSQSTFPMPTQPPPGVPEGANFIDVLNDSVAFAKQQLESWTDEQMNETWRMMNGDKAVVEGPRHAIYRTILLNHWYHHRGQLTVYLRLLDVPLPSTYGPTADEPPMF